MTSLSLLGHAPDDAVSSLLNQPEPVPRRADVVIIGGGIMGCAAAWSLSRAGLSVVLVEKNRIASQQSGRNWGFVRSLCRDPLELPLAALALSIWPGLSAALGHETGWRRSGCLFLSDTAADHGFYSRWRAAAGDMVRETHLLSADQVATRFPALTGRTEGAIIAEADGQAEPVLATLAFARAAAGAGATLLEDCGVRAIDTTGGRASGVATEFGPIAAPVVVCTAGAATYRLVGGLGLRLPQKTVRSTVALTAPLPDLGLPCFVGGGLGLRQRPDGSCVIATDGGTDIDITIDAFRASRFFLRELVRNRKGFALSLGAALVDDMHQRLAVPRAERAVRPRAPDIAANPDRVAETRRRFGTLFGGVAVPEIVKSWAGAIDVMPDALPVIDAGGPVAGLIVATGFSGHGFGLGPAVGQVLSSLAQGEAPGVDLAPFAADRFTRGAYTRPYASI
jgi:glycine/D-amino acid oxidase-like deaminating enzyme